MLCPVPKTMKGVLISKVEPNFIHNRFDIVYGTDFDLYEVTCGHGKVFIPVHVKKRKALLGVWLAPLQDVSVQLLFDEIFLRYKGVKAIGFSHCLAPVNGIEAKSHWHIDLSQGFDRFHAKLSSRTRYNMRWYEKRMREAFKYETSHYSGPKNIPIEWVKAFLTYKRATQCCKYPPPERYVRDFFVTDAWALKLDGEIAAVLFLSIVDKHVYLENLTYHQKFQQYSPGTILLYGVIRELMGEGYLTMFLGGGESEYKRRFNGIETKTYSGICYKENRKQSFSEMRRKVATCLRKLFPSSVFLG